MVTKDGVSLLIVLNLKLVLFCGFALPRNMHKVQYLGLTWIVQFEIF